MQAQQPQVFYTGVDELPGYIGVLAGVNQPSGSGANTTPALGLSAGARIIPNFGLGVFGAYFGQTSAGGLLGLPSNTAVSTGLLVGQARIYLSGLHIGAEFGGAMKFWSGTSSALHGGSSTTSLVYGPEAGYDHHLSRNFSLGGEIHYLISTAEQDVNAIQLLAAVKFWL